MGRILNRLFKSVDERKRLRAENQELRQALLKASRSFVSELKGEPSKMADTVEPFWNYTKLLSYSEINWMLGTAIDKIVMCCTKEGWEFKPKFNFKCICGDEFEAKPEQCPKCGAIQFHEPDKAQLVAIKTLFDKPNPQKTLKDLIKDIIDYNQIIDDYYLEIVPGENGKPAELWSLPAEDIRIKADRKGQFTSDEYFCRKCYSEQEDVNFQDLFYSGKQYAEQSCLKCGEKLTRTAYIQLNNNGKIIARWGEDEIIHGNSRARGHRLYGRPKIISLLAIVEIMYWMEKYQCAAYSFNKAPDSILAIPGMSQQQINDMILQIETFKKKNPHIRKNLTISVPPGSDPKILSTMSPLVDLQAKDMQNFFREAIAIRYGVSLQFMGIQTPGKLGRETEMIEVSYDTIEEVQNGIEETFNQFLLPKFPEITDWYWELVSPKKDDIRRKADIEQIKANTITTLVNIGLDVEIGDNWDLKVSGKPHPPAVQPPAPFGFSQGRGGNISKHNNVLYATFDTNASEFPIQKEELPPRGVAREDAIKNLRALEDTFVTELLTEYETEMSALRSRAATLSYDDTIQEMDRIFERMGEKIEKIANTHAKKIYMAGLKDTASEMKKPAEFEQRDENAIKWMTTRPHGIIPTLTTFGEQQRDIFGGIIRRAYTDPAGLDLDRMVRDMGDAVEGESWKMERIARTETTRISNSGRISAWEKFAPEDEYDWVIASVGKTLHENKPCPLCRAIAEGGSGKVWGAIKQFHGNPYRIGELRDLTNGFVPHANCGCTVVRRIKALEVE